MKSFYENAASRQLFTDFYELTMAYGYWKVRRMDVPAVFTYYFRSHPFHGGYAVAAGLETLVEFLEHFKFSADDLDFLATLKTPSGKAQFESAFLNFLSKSSFQCDLEATPEGTAVFRNEPLIKIRGPMWQCQFLESVILNTINFQTLIATKTARIVQASEDKSVVEFGLRRAQGFDGALSASRAAYIGGVHATSNILAGKIFGIPVTGTHAHSWVMSFDSEIEAFRAFAQGQPEGCILLVDTYDTLEGVRNAIFVAKEARQKLSGIRLDSGDLAYLGTEARRLLDEADMQETKIICSNELDEHVIQSLNLQRAPIDMWGVGTRLVTGEGQSALGGVYKLAAVFEAGDWRVKIKLSDHPEKTSNPGLHRIRRFYDSAGMMQGDLIYDESETASTIDRILDPSNAQRFKHIHKDWSHQELLVPIFSRGKNVAILPSLKEIRQRACSQLRKLHPGIRRLENPHEYPVGLSPHLSDLKVKMTREIRANMRQSQKMVRNGE